MKQIAFGAMFHMVTQSEFFFRHLQVSTSLSFFLFGLLNHNLGLFGFISGLLMNLVNGFGVVILPTWHPAVAA